MPYSVAHVTCLKASCGITVACFKTILSAVWRREVLTSAYCRNRVVQRGNSHSIARKMFSKKQSRDETVAPTSSLWF